MALKIILRAAEGENVNTYLSKNTSLIWYEATGCLITTPDEVVAKIAQMKTVALSSDPSLPPGAPFPWLGHVRPTRLSSLPMICGCFSPAIMHKALRRTPNHKVARPSGIPGLILKHVPCISRGCTPHISIHGDYGGCTPFLAQKPQDSHLQKGEPT